MEKNKKIAKVLEEELPIISSDFIDNFWAKSWTYIKTVVDVVRQPILILDKDFRVMAANESFYRTFEVEAVDTEQKVVYDLGNGQWDIPALRKLLEDILPKNTFFKGFEVEHDFPYIGPKTIILNARQIYMKEDATFPSIILLAMEDVTEMMNVAEMLAHHTNKFELRTGERLEEFEGYVKRLEKDLNKLKKKL